MGIIQVMVLIDTNNIGRNKKKILVRDNEELQIKLKIRTTKVTNHIQSGKVNRIREANVATQFVV